LAEKPAKGMGCTLDWQFPRIIRRVNEGWWFWFIKKRRGLVKVLLVDFCNRWAKKKRRRFG